MTPTSQSLAVREEKPPAPVGPHGVIFQNLDDLSRFCLAVSKSQLAPKGFQTPEAILIAIQTGAEIGLAPMQALQSIAVINGRPVLWGDAALAVASGHPDFMDIAEKFDGATNTATCSIKRRKRTAVTRTFSQDDAKKAGLWGKQGPWQQYPARMLQLRARAFALRDSFPDALRGIGIREEVRDFGGDSAPRRINTRPAATDVVLPGDEPETEPEPTPAPEGHAEPATEPRAIIMKRNHQPDPDLHQGNDPELHKGERDHEW
jgi:hypothetical protein